MRKNFMFESKEDQKENKLKDNLNKKKNTRKLRK